MNFRKFHNDRKKSMNISEKYIRVRDPKNLEKSYIYVSDDQIAHDYSAQLRMFIDDFRSLYNQSQSTGIDKREDIAFQFMQFMKREFEGSKYLEPQEIVPVKGAVKIDNVPNEHEIAGDMEQLEFNFDGDGPTDMVPHTWIMMGDSIVDFSGPQRFIKTGLVDKLTPDKYYEGYEYGVSD